MLGACRKSTLIVARVESELDDNYCTEFLSRLARGMLAESVL